MDLNCSINSLWRPLALLACSPDFELGSLHNYMNQFLKINPLSLFAPSTLSVSTLSDVIFKAKKASTGEFHFSHFSKTCSNNSHVLGALPNSQPNIRSLALATPLDRGGAQAWDNWLSASSLAHVAPVQ